MAVEKRIVVGASGASGMPLLIKCLKILRTKEEYRSLLVMSRSAKLTLEQETDWSVSQVETLADERRPGERIVPDGRHGDCAVQHENGSRDREWIH